MKKYLIILFALLLTACNDSQQIITTYRYMVVHPAESMYHCPVLKQFPEWKTLTDKEVAKTVLTLYKNNLTCKSSIESIRKFLNDADIIVKKGSK
jgi:hypothetical protein